MAPVESVPQEWTLGVGGGVTVEMHHVEFTIVTQRYRGVAGSHIALRHTDRSGIAVEAKSLVGSIISLGRLINPRKTTVSEPGVPCVVVVIGKVIQTVMSAFPGIPFRI